MTKTTPFAVVLLLAAAATAWAAGGAATVKSAKNATLGPIVVNARGMTLYRLTSERRGKIACTGACTATWPPLLASGKEKPVAGPGIAAAKLGTIRRPDGKVQVTYAGAPLYLYSGDTAAGDASGEGLEKVWFALSPSGTVVRPAPAAASRASSATTTASTSSGYGY